MSLSNLFKKNKVPKWVAVLLLIGLAYITLIGTLSILFALLRGELSEFVIDPVGTVVYFGVQVVIVWFSYKGVRYFWKYIKRK